MQLTHCVFTLIIETIKKTIFLFLENLSNFSTQISYMRRKSIIDVKKSYFEGLKCPINEENVLFRKKSYMNEISLWLYHNSEESFGVKPHHWLFCFGQKMSKITPKKWEEKCQKSRASSGKKNNFKTKYIPLSSSIPIS